VIELCRQQLNFADGLIAEEVTDLWEDWMRHVDTVLADPQLVELVYAPQRWCCACCS
jgi:IS5 family transposase